MKSGIGGSSMGIGGGAGIGANSAGYTGVGGDAVGPDSNGFVSAGSSLQSGVGEVASGRISLIMLDTLVIGLIAFYLWTHSVQRGG